MTEYTVLEIGGEWVAWADGETRLGARPKKEAAKRLCQQQAGRRELVWTWDPKLRKYTSS